MTEGDAANRVYAELRRRILTWELAPGSALREVLLAAELEVSRTPVREALQRLRADGLVVARGRRGVEVPSWQPDQLDEVYRLRADLEAWSAKRAAERMGVRELDRLRGLADEMTALWRAGDERDLEAIAALNVDFHETIREAAGSDRLHHMTSMVVHLPLLHRVFHVFTVDETEATLAEHHTLIRAFEARDPDWAEAMARAHILAALHALMRSGAASQSEPKVGPDVSIVS
jgi:DNA-binding GntR family transcriptional regulator